MRFCKISELLDWVGAFHQALATEYKVLADETDKERVAMLLKYLSEHQQKLAEATEKYEEDATANLLTTWSDQCPDMGLPESVSQLHSALSGKETGEIIIKVIEFHDMLIEMYKALADKTSNDSVKTLFEHLATLEKQEEMRTVRDALRLEDY